MTKQDLLTKYKDAYKDIQSAISHVDAINNTSLYERKNSGQIISALATIEERLSHRISLLEV